MADKMELPKTVVVTGATSGIGLAVCEILLYQGVRVVGVGRSPSRCREAEAHLRRRAPAGTLTLLSADLSLQSEVHALATRVRELIRRDGMDGLNALINNAGTFTYWQSLTPEGFETQWAVNHLAPFLLTFELLSLLQAAPEARIVTVSSGSHRGTRLHWSDLQLHSRYNPLRAYGQTKLANILFTMELNRRLGAASRVRAFAADPGLVKTDMGYKNTPSFARWIWGLRRASAITPEASARGIVFLAMDAPINQESEAYWRHGAAHHTSRAALDADSASRLWSLSSQMCGLPQYSWRTQ